MPCHCPFSLSLKPSEGPEVDEDEGFGEWSQKPEQRRQNWGTEEGTVDGGEPPLSESPEGGQAQDRHVGGGQGLEVRPWARFWLSLSPHPVPKHWSLLPLSY
jgi:hypothetical protein